MLKKRSRPSATILVNDRDLKATEVVATLDSPLTPGKNVLWCGTMQMAWNELAEFLGEEIRTTDDPPIVQSLNGGRGSVADLDGPSFVATAGIAPEVLNQIADLLRDRFRKELPRELGDVAPGDLVLYSYLLKNDLAFPKPFDPLDDPLVFGGVRVQAFGLPKRWEKDGSLKRVKDQVTLHDYRNNDDFILELDTQSTLDRVLLAKVPVGSSLIEVVQSVKERVKEGTSRRLKGEELSIPLLDFKVTKEYSELHGQRINNERMNGYPITFARQDIQFLMDEHGVRIESQSMGSARSLHIGGPVRLIFDKPFLILLEEFVGEIPYFAMWVDNAELLVPVGRG